MEWKINKIILSIVAIGIELEEEAADKVGMGLEDHLPTPQQVITSENSAAFKLSVLIAQKHKMSTWENSFDEQMDLLRLECSQGIHPVWSRLAREAPIFAEFERFDIIEEEMKTFDSKEWIKGG
jgi:hypothetical protein